jgi:hypothetical protein
VRERHRKSISPRKKVGEKEKVTRRGNKMKER